MSDDAAVRACERVVLESAACNDRRDWDALAALYADDGRLVRPSGQTAVGRDEIRAAYAGGPAGRRTRHLCTNLQVDIDADGTAATAHTVVMLVSWDHDDHHADHRDDEHDGLPVATGTSLGEFADRLMLTDRGWRIAERVARLDVRVH